MPTDEAPEWLEHFVEHCYLPTPRDFRRLRLHVNRWRRIYEKGYREPRNKYFAHKHVVEPDEIAALFSKGTIRELQRLFAFLASLHEALWELFFNGKKPTLRPKRFSAARMSKAPNPYAKTAHERVLRERYLNPILPEGVAHGKLLE